MRIHEDFTLLPIERSIATTYHFRPDRRVGWGALCTVNDRTGELSIYSDWGSWQHSWYIPHTGRPSLTHFLAGRSSAHYLADKLCKREDRERFDSYATVKEFRRTVGERYRDGDVDIDEARAMCEALDHLKGTDDQRDFVDSFYRIHDHEKILNEPWEHFRHEPTGSYIVLLEKILPALIAACAATVHQLELDADFARSG